MIINTSIVVCSATGSELHSLGPSMLKALSPSTLCIRKGNIENVAFYNLFVYLYVIRDFLYLWFAFVYPFKREVLQGSYLSSLLLTPFDLPLAWLPEAPRSIQ